MCQENGVFALFLPPYSYDFNPIEQVFHAAKAYIRRRWGYADANYPDVAHLTEALYVACNATMACNCFENSYIYVGDDLRLWATGL